MIHDKIKPCSRCHKLNSVSIAGGRRWSEGPVVHRVNCLCGARGPFAHTRDKAIRLWNMGYRTDGLENVVLRRKK